MKSIHYLLLSLLAYSLPVVIFGHWTVYNSIYFPISIVALAYLINLKSIEDKYWPTYLYAFLQGSSLSVFGISILGFTSTGTNVHLSPIWGVLVYVISALSFIILAGVSRILKKNEYEESFNNNQVAIERDKKIKKLLGNII